MVERRRATVLVTEQPRTAQELGRGISEGRLLDPTYLDDYLRLRAEELRGHLKAGTLDHAETQMLAALNLGKKVGPDDKALFCARHATDLLQQAKTGRNRRGYLQRAAGNWFGMAARFCGSSDKVVLIEQKT